MTKVEEMLARIEELKYEQRELTGKVAEEVMKFEGTLAQALEQGIVRLNFTAPSGFYRMIRNR